MKRWVAVGLATAGWALMSLAASAEEGMWTFDDLPAAQVRESLGVRLDRAWLDHLRDASVRLNSGCSASLVSPEGLALTNQHCVLACAQNLSTGAEDHVAEGFMADGRDAERACPGLEAEVLLSITDVTDAVTAASSDKFGQAYVTASESALSAAESRLCRADPALRCQVVSFFGGGQFKVYKYRRYVDVRLVFAPEMAAAFFGGDGDNFNFPRFALDCAFLRLYVAGKPASTPDFLVWSTRAPRADEAVFISGNPGFTERALSVAQLESQRDVVIPVVLSQTEELRQRLIQFSAQGPEARRLAAERLFNAENLLKVVRGRKAALADRAFMTSRRQEEADLEARLALDPKLSAEIGDPWTEIAAAQKAYGRQFIVWRQLESDAGGGSVLFSAARALVRGAQERVKPSAERLPEFADSRLLLARKRLLDARPISPDMERLSLSFWLEKTREAMGAGSPATAAFLDGDRPAALARRLVSGTRLVDPAVRRTLWDGGLAAIQASRDPLIAYVRATDPLSRAAREIWEDRVLGPTQRASERLERARFALDGHGAYPDATFTLRFSYGKVAGWGEGGARIGPFTTLAGLYARAKDADPYRLAPRWRAAQTRLDPATVFDFVTTNDIIGGNSGSPVVAASGEIIGTAFDGNAASIAGDFAYDGAANRTVALSTAAITEALDKVYGRADLVRELDRGGAGTAPSR
jgi:hypothetical protein